MVFLVASATAGVAVRAVVALVRDQQSAVPLAVRGAGLEEAEADRFTRTLAEVARSLEDHPGFRVRIERDPAFQRARAARDQQAAQAAAADVGAGLSSRGLGRLDAADLVSWHEIRVRAAASDVGFCASVWTGRQGPHLVRALATLSETDLREWARVIGIAMRVELDAQAPLPAVGASFERHLDRMVELADERTRAILERGLGGATLSDDEACVATRALFAYAATLGPAEKTTFVRDLAIVGAGDVHD